MRHYYINGIKVSLTNPEEVIDLIKNYQYNAGNYICFFGLYPLIQSAKDTNLKKALNNSFLNPLHGKSIEFYLKSKGYKNLKTVDGVFVLDRLLKENISHYFYGASENTLTKIKVLIKRDYPSAKVLGYKSPPPVEIEKIEKNDILNMDIAEIDSLKPNIVWIGMGGIKQDLFMYYYSDYLEESLLIGVGAVFDYFAGDLSLSPEIIKKLGLRWLYRIFIQPNIITREIKVIKALGAYFLRKILCLKK